MRPGLSAALAAVAALLAVVPPPSVATAAPAPGAGQPGALDLDASAARVRKLLEELVAANTENPPGNEARAATIGAARLREAGIPFQVFEFAPGRTNLVARLKGSGSARPLLLLAHTDVVPTAGQPWTAPPHAVTEKDGRLFGRGVLDDLSMAAVELEVLVELHRSRTPLKRDMIVAWTGGEETGGEGIRWQLQNHPEAIADAGLALNEGGGLRLGEDGKVSRASLLVAEKTYVDFELRAKGTSGHSSAPRPDNAIYRLARALDRLGQHRFPVRVLPVTRAWLAAAASTEETQYGEAMRVVAAAAEPPAAALEVMDRKPHLAALLRTTCVATQLSGGTSRNVLPSEAVANMNCRVLPDESADDVRRALAQVVADPGVEIAPVGAVVPDRPAAVDGELPQAIRAVLGRLHPGTPVIPQLVSYFTDSRSLRGAGIQAYGLGVIPVAEKDGLTAHGADERIPASSLRAGFQLLHEIVLELAR